MKQLNTHNVELPDGRLVTVEGGNAESIAHLLAETYLKGQPGQSPLVSQQHPAAPVHNGEEPPLSLPVWNFRKTEPEPASVVAASQPAVAPAAPVNNGAEPPLSLPVWTFAKPGRSPLPTRSSMETRLSIANGCPPAELPLPATPLLFPRK